MKEISGLLSLLMFRDYGMPNISKGSQANMLMFSLLNEHGDQLFFQIRDFMLGDLMV